jgi:hypothetical protein
VNGRILEINDGSEITINRTTTYGGGIYVENRGSVIISGGLISENTVDSEYVNRGGGICIRDNSTVTMMGGIISKNTSTRGAGVWVENNDSSFTKRAAAGSSTSGIIYGGTGDNANTAYNNYGHAIRREFGTLQNRNSTLGYYDEISSVSDVGWE